MKNVVIVAPMEPNGRYHGGIMTVANTLFDHRGVFADHQIRLDKFNTYIRYRTSESIGKLNLTNLLNMTDIFTGLMKVTRKASQCDTLYYNSSINMALLKDLIIIRLLRMMGRRQRIVLHIHFAEMAKILPRQSVFAKWMLKTLKNQVDHIVFLSQKTRAEFIEAGISPEKTSVIYNFHNGMTDAETVNEKAAAILCKEKIELLFMGSIEQKKGILDLLSALQENPDRCILHVCGSCSDASVKSAYNAMLKELEGVVVDHGFVSGAEKERILSSSDCIVLPSYGEGFPLVLIDAMAMGCTCITTSVGAVPEFINDPRNGYLFEAGDIQQLRCCIRRLCLEREKTAAQMKANYALADSYSLDRFIQSLCQVL